MPENAITRDNREKLYVAVAGQTAFPVTFYFEQDKDLEFGTLDGDGKFTALTVTSDYSVSGAGSEQGGTITLASGAVAGTKYRLRGSAQLEMTRKLTAAGVKAETINAMVQRSLIWVAEVARDIGIVNAAFNVLNTTTLPAIYAIRDNVTAKLAAITGLEQSTRTAKTSAETARDASVSAKNDSVSAKNASESARDAALGYRNEASQHKDTATSKAGIATTKAGEASASALSAAGSATTATQKAALTAADRTQTGQDRVATTADRVQTGADRSAVATDKSEVATNKATVATHKNAVDTAKASVDASKATVILLEASASTSATTATTKAGEAAASATTASNKAAQTAADRTQTGQDRGVTTADRIAASAAKSSAESARDQAVAAASQIDGSAYAQKSANLSDLSDKAAARASLSLDNVNNTSDADKPISTATQAALAGKASTSHSHSISEITNLQTSLSGKANIGHIHNISQVSGLQSALDSKAAASHTHSISNDPDFKSTDQTITAGGLITLAHGLSVRPSIANIHVALKCSNAEGGFVAGDEIPAQVSGGDGGAGAGSKGCVPYADASNIYVRVGASGFNALGKNTGILYEIGLANWKIVVRAWK